MMNHRALSRRNLVLGAGAAFSLAACSGPARKIDPNRTGNNFSRGATPYTSEENYVAAAGIGPFRAKFAPHFGMFEDSAGVDLEDQLKFAADQGFTAWEDNYMPNRPPEDQERLAQTMRDVGIEMGVFVLGDRRGWLGPTITTADPEASEAFLRQVDRAIECARRTGAKYMTVLSGRKAPSMRRQYQMAHLIDNLRRACDRVEQYGLVLALEPINTSADFPNVFLDRTYDAYLICKAVERPGCRLLFDIYHQQVMDGNIISEIDAFWDEISYFQVGDHPGRNEPGSGEINYANVLQHIQMKGYRGIIGMEHGVNGAGPEGEAELIARYRRLDAIMHSAL